MTRRSLPISERLERLSMPEPNSGCVIWLGYIEPLGYGRLRVTKAGDSQLAHVMSYRTYVGPVPDGMELDHLCRVHCCIAPWHLEPVTHQVNMLRGETLASRNAVKTMCINDHPFDDDNTYWDARGWRSCKICRSEASSRKQSKRRLAMAS